MCVAHLSYDPHESPLCNIVFLHFSVKGFSRIWDGLEVEQWFFKKKNDKIL